jgi:hypothetical protein
MDNESNFDAFRRRFAPNASKPGITGIPYEAFGTKDRLYRIDLRPADGVAHALPYSHLLLLTYDRRNYAEIFLTISGVAATIKGRNLRPIVDALKLHTCEFVQAFESSEYAEPQDTAAPFVESIQVEIIRGRDATERHSKKDDSSSPVTK